MSRADHGTKLPAASAEQNQPSRIDPWGVLARVLDPGVWQLVSLFPPPAGLRILAAIFGELPPLISSPEQQATKNQQILDNAAKLGLELSPQRARALLERHHRYQAMRHAETTMLLAGDVGAQVQTLLETAVMQGLGHPRRIAEAGRGAIVVSAHLGPMIYAVPALAHGLAKHKLGPQMYAVMYAPRVDLAGMVDQQLERFAAFHRAPLRFELQRPTEQLGIGRTMLRTLSRGGWVAAQLDVLQGARGKELSFAGKTIRLPGIWTAVRLAYRYGVPILPVYCWHSRNKDHLGFRFESPVEVATKEMDRQAALAQAAQKLATALERWVLKDPAGWGMLGWAHRLI